MGQVSNPIVFLLGPSGAGKTTLAGWIAEDMGFSHIEIDRFPEGDGIDLAGLRPEWDTFCNVGDSVALAAAIRSRVEQVRAAGAVLSFPSTLVLPIPLMDAAAVTGIRSLILFGPEDRCLASLLTRPDTLSRRLDRCHGRVNNLRSHAVWASSDFGPYRMEAFEGPAHRTRQDLVAEVRLRVLGR